MKRPPTKEEHEKEMDEFVRKLVLSYLPGHIGYITEADVERMRKEVSRMTFLTKKEKKEIKRLARKRKRKGKDDKDKVL